MTIYIYDTYHVWYSFFGYEQLGSISIYITILPFPKLFVKNIILSRRYLYLNLYGSPTALKLHAHVDCVRTYIGYMYHWATYWEVLGLYSKQ